MSGPASMSIADILENIESEKLKQREAGLEDLKTFFNNHRRTPAYVLLEHFEDVSIHMFFDALFRTASNERTNYAKAGKSTLRSAAASRLASCAAAARLAAETTAKLMEKKTVRLFIVHVIQTLPMSDGFCKPLSADYLKALKFVLSQQAHVEELKLDTWFDIVDFCSNGVVDLDVSADSFNAPIGRSLQVSFSTQANGQGGKRPLSNDSGQIATELLECLGWLCRASNAPLLERAGSIRDSVVQLLQNYLLPRQAQQASFVLLNLILERLASNSTKEMILTVSMMLPTIKSFWPEHRASALRDEMLISLVHFKSHMVHMLHRHPESKFVLDVEQLLESMRRDYFEHRSDRGHLELDDLRLHDPIGTSQDSMPMQSKVFSLRASTVRSEYNWTNLHFIAFFSCWLDKHYLLNKQAQTPTDRENTHKRRKVSSNFEECLSQLTSKSKVETIYAAQILVFELQQRVLTESEIRQTLDHLLRLLSSDQASLCSWALVGIAACAFQDAAVSEDLGSLWFKAAQISARLLSSTSTSRAASYTVHVLLSRHRVNFPDLQESLEPIVSATALNGPAVLSDASLAAWSTMLEHRAIYTPGSATSTAYDQFLGWLFSKWNPRNFENRLVSSALRSVSSFDLTIAFVPSAKTELLATEPSRLTILSQIGQAWLSRWRSRELTKYLLLIDTFQWVFPEWVTEPSQVPLPTNDPLAVLLRRDSQVVTSLAAELDATLESWNDMVRTKSVNLSQDVVHAVSSLMVVATVTAHDVSKRHRERSQALMKKANALSTAVFMICSNPEFEDSIVISVAENLIPFCPNLEVVELEKLQLAWNCLSPIAHGFVNAVKTRRSQLEENADHAVNELDDMDFAVHSEASQKPSQADFAFPRTELAACCHPQTLLSSTEAYLKLLCYSTQSAQDESLHTVPKDFVTYLMALPVTNLAACRPFLRSIWLSDIRLEHADADRLFDHLMTVFAENDELYRCEVAIGVLLDFMTGNAALWALEETSSLAKFAAQYYEFLVDKALKAGVVSPNIFRSVTDMLYRVWSLNPSFLPNPELPSVRTVIFNILENGELSVQYHASKDLPNIFGKFILSQHDLIFEDIHEKLPKDLDKPESIALRLQVLSRLGASWKTLLRRCLYHIFETAGLVHDATLHAKFCVEQICSRLAIQHPPELFCLFSSQLLYTWLESRPLDTIPYSIFSYHSLKDLLADSMEDITSQSVMRSALSTQQELETILVLPRKNILIQSFARAAAYALASDSSAPPDQAAARTSETNLREMVGDSEYSSLIKRHYPTIVGHLFVRLEREEQIEKAIGKRPGYEDAASALKAMKDISSADSALPASQQPSFKSKHLLDELERLCRRIKRSYGQLWTPYVTCLVARMLLDDLKPAFGALHAARVIKRLRIMIALASRTALQGYALELVLHALAPFVTNSQCADDAIGVFQYLMDGGKEYLVTNASFVASTCLSVFLSLQRFLTSTHDSTTQESQHKTTLEKASSFHAWLSRYIDQFKPKSLSEGTADFFKAIMKSAQDFRHVCSAQRDIPESQLLLQILDDAQSYEKLLSSASWNASFGSLCELFSETPSFRLDVLGHGDDAAKFADALWTSSRHPKANDAYRKWAVRALGRAFAQQGKISTSITQERRFKTSPAPTKLYESQATILDFLANHLRDENAHAVSLVEETLRKALNKINPNEGNSAIFTLLPENLLISLTPDSSTTVSESKKHIADHAPLEKIFREVSITPSNEWIESLATGCIRECEEDGLLKLLPQLFSVIGGMAERMFPYILHLALLAHHERSSQLRDTISTGFHRCFSYAKISQGQNKLLLSALLYLHEQPFPKELSHVDRKKWLQIDYLKAANAARDCQMLKTALYFLELSQTSDERASKRASSILPVISNDLLLSIYADIDEPDSFYGVPRPPNLNNIAERLDFEGNRMQSLLLRGAQADSTIRSGSQANQGLSQEIVRLLKDMNLNNLTRSVITSSASTGDVDNLDSLLTAAIKLRQWDVSVPPARSTSLGAMYKTFQRIHNAQPSASLPRLLDQGLLDTFKVMDKTDGLGPHMRFSVRALAALAEADEIFGSVGEEQMEDLIDLHRSRDQWMSNSSVKDCSTILTTRETLFGMMNDQANLRSQVGLDMKGTKQFEVAVNLQSADVYRELGAMQESLATVTYLNDCIEPCHKLGVIVDGAIKQEIADILWERQELDASISTLQDLQRGPDLKEQSVFVDRASLLATLGSRVSDARLERPDEILHNYLMPALAAVEEQSSSQDAGEVYHKFASYCHDQLRSPESAQEFSRSARLQEQKLSEMEQLKDAMRTAKTEKEKKSAKEAHSKAGKWFELDQRDHERLKKAREQFLQQSLENYLKCLSTTDAYDTDALRFVALWLEYCKDESANKVVGQHMSTVPSHKFASLMNQLASRVQDEKDTFQTVLQNIVERICSDHPYHGMHHIFAGSKTSGGNDRGAQSRNAATLKIAQKFRKGSRSSKYWNAIDKSDSLLNKLAKMRSDESKPGSKFQLRKFDHSRRVERDVPLLNVPPVTQDIPIRADLNYDDIPYITSFKPEMTIPSGISAPKILVAITSDGCQYTQLYKGGQDDLRQDAIMEQVFALVTDLLAMNKSTRQRKLKIRTYKVVPLDATSGAIEFVQPTMPLNDFLTAAHPKFHRQEYKWNTCRNKIRDAHDLEPKLRVAAYKDIASNFTPVLRHFFFESFPGPDEWFERRLAYTRSTAAISILGHVLGLGDRHCQNILLDTATGEVIHIDLGVAFEAGRVLPYPETVPFRLTRDIVDGFGVLGTEGVFRRCCEFTLEALRENKDAIMTLLNVLRYDPLYSWSVSPLRAKRLQEEQEKGVSDDAANATAAANGSAATTREGLRGGASTRKSAKTLAAELREDSEADSTRKREEEEGGEAGRALGVVERKLATGLSAAATVNELIQQATDEKNLALLYCGWSAFA